MKLLSEDIYQQNQKNEVLSDEINRLEYEKKGYMEEILSLKEKYVEYNTLYNKYIDTLAKNVTKSIEIECLRGN